MKQRQPRVCDCCIREALGIDDESFVIARPGVIHHAAKHNGLITGLPDWPSMSLFHVESVIDVPRRALHVHKILRPTRSPNLVTKRSMACHVRSEPPLGSDYQWPCRCTRCSFWAVCIMPASCSGLVYVSPFVLPHL